MPHRSITILLLALLPPVLCALSTSSQRRGRAGLASASVEAGSPTPNADHGIVHKSSGIGADHEDIEAKAREIAESEVERVHRENQEDAERLESVRAAKNEGEQNSAVRSVLANTAAQKRELRSQVEDIKKEREVESQTAEEKAEKAVMSLYHQEAEKLLTRGDGPEEDPFSDEKNTATNLGPWLQSNPRLHTGRPMTMLDEAIDEAEQKATAASDKDAPTYKAIADRIKSVSSSTVGQQLEEMMASDSLLVQKKALSEMRLVVYKAYNDGLGKHGNAYRRAYECQKAVKAALDAIGLADPSTEQQAHLCQKKLYEAESKLRIESAVGAALVVAEKGFSGNTQCPNANEVSQHMRIAQQEVRAVKSACPDMNVQTEGSSMSAVRARSQIRSAIAKEMSAQLEKAVGSSHDGAHDEVKRILADAKHAWEDVQKFSVGSPVPEGLDVYPHGADPMLP